MADMETHAENLERVSLRIAASVKQFFREMLCRENRLFHADDLRNHVTAMTGINAPASADRVMRDLRLKYQLDYRVVSRRESLYEALSVRPEPGEPPEGEPAEPEPSYQGPPTQLELNMEGKNAIQSALVECEAIIERGRQTFVGVGLALRRIRDERLYQLAHATFEDYCLKRWGWRRAHAYRQIDAAHIAMNLSPIGDIPKNEAGRGLSPIGDKPKNESQMRPLAGLPPEVQREVWNEAVQASPNGRVTARAVRERAQARVAKRSSAKQGKVNSPRPKEPEVRFLERILEQVTARLKEADAIGKRTWNVDACSKRALAQGLYEVYRAMTLRLREFQAKQNRNGHSVSQSKTRREEAIDLPLGGEREEIDDTENKFAHGSVN